MNNEKSPIQSQIMLHFAATVILLTVLLGTAQSRLTSPNSVSKRTVPPGCGRWTL